MRISPVLFFIWIIQFARETEAFSADALKQP